MVLDGSRQEGAELGMKPVGEATQRERESVGRIASEEASPEVPHPPRHNDSEAAVAGAPKCVNGEKQQ
jgi:hypothetical protein